MGLRTRRDLPPISERIRCSYRMIFKPREVLAESLQNLKNARSPAEMRASVETVLRLQRHLTKEQMSFLENMKRCSPEKEEHWEMREGAAEILSRISGPDVPLKEALRIYFKPYLEWFDLVFRKEKALSEAMDSLRHASSYSDASKISDRILILRDLLSEKHMDELRYLAKPKPSKELRVKDEVQCAAALALAKLRDSGSKSIFISLLHSRDPSLVDAALLGLGNIRQELKWKCRDAIRTFLRNEDDFIVSAATRALSVLGDTSAVRFLMFHASKDSNLSKRRIILEGIGQSLLMLAKQDSLRAEKTLKIISRFRQTAWYAEQQRSGRMLYSEMESWFERAERAAKWTLWKAKYLG